MRTDCPPVLPRQGRRREDPQRVDHPSTTMPAVLVPAAIMVATVLLSAAPGSSQARPEAAPQADGNPGKPLWNIPVAGAPVSLPGGLMLCAPASAPFRGRRGDRAVTPGTDPTEIGASTELSLGANLDQCEHGPIVAVAQLTAPWPELSPNTITLYADEGRLDAAGKQLTGSQLLWRRGNRDWLDTCHEPQPAGELEQCTWAITRKTSASPESNALAFLPRGARLGHDALWFDGHGQQLRLDNLFVRPAKIVLERLFPSEASVDLATGVGILDLLHPEAVGSVTCSPLACEMRGGQLVVLGSAQPVEHVTATVRLRPRVTIRQDGSEVTERSSKVLVTTCPMSIVSGEPFRDTDHAAVVVRLEGLCAADIASLRFEHQHEPLTVKRIVHHDSHAYVLLQVGNIGANSMAITAVRNGQVAIAVARSVVRNLPTLRASLEVPGYPNVDFIPTNRWATVHVVSHHDDIQAVALPIDGVYEARYDAHRSYVRGNRNASGMTSLQFAIRDPSLPGPLAQTNLAVVQDVLLRGIREANLPAPLHAATEGEGEGENNKPLVELLCEDADGGGLVPLPIGSTVNLPFRLRDNCRVVFHRERLDPKYGTQRIRLEVDVYDVDGRARGDAHVSETLTLRHGDDTREAFIHGITSPFDRLAVRIGHEADESHYLGASEVDTGAPAAKWTAIFGAARARLYATTAFPTGLYRVSSNDASGLLSLNFGILSRLTWLDEEGHEGFIGLEAGLIVVGIGNAVTGKDDNLTQLGAVVGLGLSVPFANRSSSAQASINVHAWLEVDLTHDEASASDGRIAFIFGPSISIGNLGTNL